MSKQIFNPLSGTFDTVNDQAVEIQYDPSGSSLVATETQAALDEVAGRLDATETVANAAIPSSEKAAALGVATLDAGGKIPAAQLPNSVMEYLGTWAASTNTPTLTNGTGNAGDVYVASDAGTVDFGAGPITFAAGDWVVYSGTVWEKSVNSNAVASVNGFTGAVSLDTDDIPEGTAQYFTDERAQDAVGNILVDGTTIDFTYNDAAPSITAEVATGSLTNNEISASAAIARTKLASGTANRVVVNNGSGQLSDNAAITANRALASDLNGLPVASTTTDTELGYVSGVTSAIQTQLNGKEPTITTLPISKGGTNSGAALNNNRIMQSSGGAIIEAAAITADRALISDTNGIPTHSAVTNVELGYVSGAQSSLQAQIDQESAIKGDNRNFGTSVGQWATYADAAQATPVDGTGGTPAITFTRQTSAPLNGFASARLSKPAANEQGEGASLLIDVPAYMRGQPLQYKLNYSASANFGYGNPFDLAASPSDVMVYAYDVTNAVLITPYPNALSGGNFAKGAFQVPTNCTQIRLILHIATTNALAWDLDVDNVELVLAPNEYVNADSDWVAYTPTFTGFGVVTNIEFKYRRVGASIEVNGRAEVGTPTAVEARLSLPTGLTTATITNNKGAGVYFNGATVTTHGGLVIVESGRNYFNFGSAGAFGSSSVNPYAIQQAVNVMTAGGVMVFNASVEIQGWTSGTIHPAALGLNAQAVFNVHRTTTTTIGPNNSAVKVPFNAVSKDTVGGFDLVNSRYICRTPGTYIFTGTVSVNNTNVQNANHHVRIYKNGNFLLTGSRETTPAANSIIRSITTTPVDMAYGDYVELFFFGGANYSVSNLTVNSGDTNTYFGGHKIGSESQPYAPRIAYLKDVKASGTGGGSATAGSYFTKTLNTLTGDSSFVSLASNQFTLQPGTYHIDAISPAYRCDRHKAKLRNITDSSDVILGSSRYVTSAIDSSINDSIITGTFTITTAKVFEIQHRVSTTNANSNALGEPSTFGDSEVYTQVKITKVL